MSAPTMAEMSLMTARREVDEALVNARREIDGARLKARREIDETFECIRDLKEQNARITRKCLEQLENIEALERELTEANAHVKTLQGMLATVYGVAP